MAISKGHVILDPSSGSGDTQLTLKAESANVGNREIVKTVFTVKAAGVSPAEITVSTRRFGSQCTSYNQHDIYCILTLCLSLSCMQKYVNSWGAI